VIKLRFFGCLSFRPAWRLTSRGWIITLLVFLAAIIFALKTVEPFLAVNKPVQGDILVVEGWLPDDALEQAAQEFDGHGYRKLVTTGEPLRRGSYLVKYTSYAQLAASTLTRLGVDPKHIVVVPAPRVRKDRTWVSALALKQWLQKSVLEVHSVDVLTLGPHARRSRLLFKQALGPGIRVGVIAIKDTSYDPARWWRSSRGVRTVIGETIAFLYARFLFFPVHGRVT